MASLPSGLGADAVACFMELMPALTNRDKYLRLFEAMEEFKCSFMEAHSELQNEAGGYLCKYVPGGCNAGSAVSLLELFIRCDSVCILFVMSRSSTLFWLYFETQYSQVVFGASSAQQQQPTHAKTQSVPQVHKDTFM